MKCIVKDCENHSNEGKFNGVLCYPCHAFITNGEGVHSQVYRNTKREWVGLTKEEAADCWSNEAVRTWHAIGTKLKEKNT